MAGKGDHILTAAPSSAILSGLPVVLGSSQHAKNWSGAEVRPGALQTGLTMAILKECFICGSFGACKHRELDLLSPTLRAQRLGYPQDIQDIAYASTLQLCRDPRTLIQWRCHGATKRAIKSGKIIRPSLCDKCGLACKPHAHHWDYDHPLQVEWLCKSCHGKADVLRRTLELPVENGV